jgi:hypothetical protein
MQNEREALSGFRAVLFMGKIACAAIGRGAEAVARVLGESRQELLDELKAG